MHILCICPTVFVSPLVSASQYLPLVRTQFHSICIHIDRYREAQFQVYLHASKKKVVECFQKMFELSDRNLIFFSKKLNGFQCTEARNGEGRRTGGSCSKWQTAHMAVSIHA